MSLQMPFAHPSGLDAPDAVWIIEQVGVDWPRSITLTMRIYASVAAYGDMRPSIGERTEVVPFAEFFAPLFDGTVPPNPIDPGATMNDVLHHVLLGRPTFANAERVDT